jgi:hypothetical protein
MEQTIQKRTFIPEILRGFIEREDSLCLHIVFPLSLIFRAIVEGEVAAELSNSSLYKAFIDALGKILSSFSMRLGLKEAPIPYDFGIFILKELSVDNLVIGPLAFHDCLVINIKKRSGTMSNFKGLYISNVELSVSVNNFSLLNEVLAPNPDDLKARSLCEMSLSIKAMVLEGSFVLKTIRKC